MEAVPILSEILAHEAPPIGGYARGDARPRPKGWAAVAVGGAGLVASTALMLRGTAPFATMYYVFAWYSTLLALYGVLALVAGRSPALRRPASLATMLGWSVVVWLFFEMVNFRLHDWYYVFVPRDVVVRWLYIAVSFATVLPAVFGAEAVLDGLGVAERVRWPRLRVTPRLLRRIRLAGIAALVLPLLFPRWCFPLVWGAATLLLEPSVYERDRERSLLHDLEEGRPGRVLRILIGGAAIGFLWELFNIRARGKWIYTVPGLEEAKLFEMPVLGFFGFPPFAVDCFVIWQLLVLNGLAVPLTGRPLPARRLKRWGAALAALVFSGLVLWGMESRTISSVTPQLADLPSVPAPELRDAGYDVFTLGAASPAAVSLATGASEAETARWVGVARLATLRGIGARNARALLALGITSPESLAAFDPGRLVRALRETTGRRVEDARVRVWVRAARAAARRPG